MSSVIQDVAVTFSYVKASYALAAVIVYKKVNPGRILDVHLSLSPLSILRIKNTFCIINFIPEYHLWFTISHRLNNVLPNMILFQKVVNSLIKLQVKLFH